MKKLTLSLFALVLMLALAACGSTKEEDKPADNAAPEDKPAEESKEVTIKHELGETTLEKNPEKVVVFDFGTLDTLDELGVEVAGLPQTNVPGYLSKYEDEKYENLGSLKEPDFEAIHALKPDVIFISGRQSDLYDQFTEIAPTIFTGVDTSRYMDSFKENMETIATIFDKEDEMKTELNDVDASIEGIKAKTAELDSNALIILGTEGKVSAYGPSSRFGIIHDVFGFKPADEGIEVSTHGQNITFEYILETNPDILFIIDRDAAIGDGSAKDSIENDLVKKTNAFKNDKMIYLNGEYWYLSGGGLQSFKEMVKEVEAAL
ncbi:iron chelate ABC superfamily ATP binding cassette transporter, binding protein [Sporosarcina newyorkensis 2681]|uniref:Iron chelate ABC superfamily ATP binding cassette transporter, binding protein n=1 Tax=Sporosarcina newyorkensis 2681 TaxID=1027292 RepID=F9DTW4_9BACL|nr:siderophore ABC transporter substrate-binding protein [Sporosarcina newyorkensis]EGQ25148.1 iron chelate ABC superfamily ATP binding cassette transporter, binding protein [Sporosarcina newyorkensis 2681]